MYRLTDRCLQRKIIRKISQFAANWFNCKISSQIEMQKLEKPITFSNKVDIDRLPSTDFWLHAKGAVVL